MPNPIIKGRKDLIKSNKIPIKLEGVFPIDSIPTRNKLIVIDNYSPDYNYMVEGDKMYYSAKGKNEWTDISSNEIARKNLYNHISKYNFRGYEDNESSIAASVKKGNFNYVAYRNESNNPKPQPKIVNDESDRDIFEDISYYANLGVNAAKRFVDKKFGGNESVSKSLLPTQEIKGEYGIIPGYLTGDTINASNNKYYLPESIDLNSTKLGYRNRNSTTPITTEGAIITTFNPFQPRTAFKENGTYVGIDSSGKFKAGNLSDFSDSDMITKTVVNRVRNFVMNGDKISLAARAKGNISKLVPEVDVIENGKVKRGSLNFLVNSKEPVTNTFGDVTGGRAILKAGKETRLVSGSIDNIREEFDALKARTGSEFVDIYALDNGTYNTALRSRKGLLNSADLVKYDARNAGGGNFLYLKDKDGNFFKSDTTLTPNVRTINSDSYKEGHGLVNEQKGIVLHHTGGNDYKGAVKVLTTPGGNSAHVVIDKDGSRNVLATPDKVTFHAGDSKFKGRKNVNDFMLGIEFVGDTNIKDLTDAQVKSAVEYLKPIIRKNNISLQDIVTHESIRDKYNKFRIFGKADSKVDISNSSYTKVVNALIKDVYYSKNASKVPYTKSK